MSKALAVQAPEVIENEAPMPVDDSTMDELDAFLLEMEEQDSKSEIVEITDEEADAIEVAAELVESKEEAYQEQDKTLEAYEAKPLEAEEKPAKKTKAVSAKGLKPSEAIKAKLGDKVYSTVLKDESESELSESDLQSLVDSRLAGFDTLAKKVGEKVVNFYAYLNGGVQLSTYTKTAIDLLKKNEEITILQIKNMYMDHPYSPGTASAQSSQMMNLLPVLGLAVRDGKTLKINPSSAVLPLLG